MHPISDSHVLRCTLFATEFPGGVSGSVVLGEVVVKWGVSRSKFGMPPQSPSPSHILRVHSSQIVAVSFSDDNERIYSGDLSGNVVATSTRTLRSLASWKAHNDSLLGLQEWKDSIVTSVCHLALSFTEN